MKYKIGDKVRVREDLIVDQVYGQDTFEPEMASFKGQTVTIKKIQSNKYILEEDFEEWYWTEEMFSGKVSEDFSFEESVSRSITPEE